MQAAPFELDRLLECGRLLVEDHETIPLELCIGAVDEVIAEVEGRHEAVALGPAGEPFEAREVRGEHPDTRLVSMISAEDPVVTAREVPQQVVDVEDRTHRKGVDDVEGGSTIDGGEDSDDPGRATAHVLSPDDGVARSAAHAERGHDLPVAGVDPAGCEHASGTSREHAFATRSDERSVREPEQRAKLVAQESAGRPRVLGETAQAAPGDRSHVIPGRPVDRERQDLTAAREEDRVRPFGQEQTARHSGLDLESSCVAVLDVALVLRCPKRGTNPARSRPAVPRPPSGATPSVRSTPRECASLASAESIIASVD